MAYPPSSSVAFSHMMKERAIAVLRLENQRLSTIHSSAKFVATRSPEHISWCSDIRKIQFKKTTRPLIACLDPREIKAVLDAPNRCTVQGTRDYALHSFTIQSQELARQRDCNQRFDACPFTPFGLWGREERLDAAQYGRRAQTFWGRSFERRVASENVFLGTP